MNSTNDVIQHMQSLTESSEAMVSLARSGEWDELVEQEGKRRPARDIVIPAGLAATEIQGYLADLLHEQATERHPTVEQIG